jgi:short-subunit dehydrogenase
MITGAAGGLGRAFAVECASRGWNLVLTDINEGALTTLAQGLRAAWETRVETRACDLTDPSALAALFDEVHAYGLRFWALINVAGVDFEGPFYAQTGEHIRAIVRLNIEATLCVTHAILPYRQPTAPFRIINVASLAAYAPMPAKATYAASKRFLLDFSLALREEVRPLGGTVTVLCPAGMPTNASCIAGIQAQGWMGAVTTCNTGRVAHETIEAALAGRAVVIPGAANRLLQALSGLLPAGLAARMVGRRWQAAQASRAEAADAKPYPAPHLPVGEPEGA